jgi:hypothetical protein
MSTLDQSIGAVEIGVLLSSVLYGVLTVQAFLYTDKHSTDPLYLRIMVSEMAFPPLHHSLTPSCHLGCIYLVGIVMHLERNSYLTFHPQDLRNRSYRFRLGSAVLLDGHELRETCCD